MQDTVRMIRDLLDARERRNALLLFAMMLVMGLLEVVGVASVMPFVTVVANPEVVSSNDYLATIYNKLGFTDTNTFLIVLGLVVFIFVVGSLAFMALTHWAIARYAHMRSYTLSSRLLRGYLGRPYSFFLNRHSADLSKSVLSEVNQVVVRVLMPAMELLANSIIAIFLIALVIVVDPFVAISAVFVLGGAYALIYIVLRKYISRIGAERIRANQARFQVAQEALGGIKNVKVLGLEDGYVQGFRKPANRFARVQAKNKIIGEMPKFVLRALVFGGMLAMLTGLLITRGGDLSKVLPLIALYTFAGLRIMPALQKIYKAVTSLRFGKPALDALHKDLIETKQVGIPAKANLIGAKPEPIRLKERLELDHICYTYPAAGQPALNDLSLSIGACTTVGIVGATGSGKTTVVDIILGLLEPQTGSLKVDNRCIGGKNVRAWQRDIGYVPQSIFLTDDTISANIAFGESPEHVDQEVVERVARIAELHAFVKNNLPDGYGTFVGERGVRLSGGQRQRIGIARALYNDPGLLVFDEATSALDNLTEKAVMDAVHNLGHRKTIIIIAHRLGTVRECDVIFLLDNGKLMAQGSYNELLEENDLFRAMASSM